jgi:aminopeptidase N
MIKKFLFVSALFCGLHSFSQKEIHSCAAQKKFGLTAKSATLNQAEIAKSELYDVHFYALDVEMTNQNTSISGTGEIHGKTRVVLDSVLFELFDSFSISEIRLNNQVVNYARRNSAIIVPVNLASNQNFRIAVDYSGTPPTAATNPLGGSGMSNATSPSWGNRVTWSLSEPFSAYEWWPCKQSLTDKADSVSVKITVPETCMAGSNGLLENTVALADGKKRFEWFHRHPIVYYLVSVAVAEYVEYNVYANPTTAPNPILIQNYIYNNPQTLINFQNDINETVDFMEYFSDIFGLYPFHDEKYGHCMAPLSGGMEHQTMTTQGFFTNTLTAHELAHQWWGNSVTCGSWADIWVNEGFASYSEYLMLAQLYPGQQVSDMNSRHQNIMNQAGGSIYVYDSLNANQIFSGRLTYDKGAAFVHTLRFIIDNDEQFFQGLRNVLTTYANKTALGIDVQQALEVISGKDLSPAFEQWYFGQGYPTYSVQWNLIGQDLHLLINHTSSMPSVTPTFTNPIQLRFIRPGTTDTIVRFDIGANSDSFIINDFAQSISQITIDPANWIINKVGSIQQNQDLNVVSTENFSKSNSPIIYPNPVNDELSIDLPTNEIYSLSILDPAGKIIYQNEISTSIKLSFENQANGYYFIHLKQTSGELEFQKLILKK